MKSAFYAMTHIPCLGPQYLCHNKRCQDGTTIKVTSRCVSFADVFTYTKTKLLVNYDKSNYTIIKQPACYSINKNSVYSSI